MLDQLKLYGRNVIPYKFPLILSYSAKFLEVISAHLLPNGSLAPISELVLKL